MEWSKELETNIDIIDDQHKEIIRRMQDVIVFGKIKDKPYLLRRALRLLGNYCGTHFSQEEHLQLKYHYPEYNAHKQLHITFLKQVVLFQEAVAQKENLEALSLEIEKAVGDWLVHHICNIDKKFAAYILSKGGTPL